jgi:hypothetical protein
MLTAYPPDLYNTQRLLFDATSRTCEAAPVEPPEEFYERGWAVLDGIQDHDHAVALQESLIAGIDATRVPSVERFAERIQLGKADLIPVCDDVVATSFQVLHFDMGLPLLEGIPQLLVTHVGIYLPSVCDQPVTARTRLVELDGILASQGLVTAEVEARLIRYVREHGDGWGEHNTRRLACFVRFIDALAAHPELTEKIDKTVGQWFMDGARLDSDEAYAMESAFYARHGVGVACREHEVLLKPGQLLFVDNTRVVHGRTGRRRAREIFNFMFGVPTMTDEDVSAIREDVCTLMVGG